MTFSLTGSRNVSCSPAINDQLSGPLMRQAGIMTSQRVTLGEMAQFPGDRAIGGLLRLQLPMAVPVLSFPFGVPLLAVPGLIEQDCVGIAPGMFIPVLGLGG
jgi:hypothetical protein